MTKNCEICQTRPVMPKGQMLQVHGVSFPYCEPCLVEAEWENVHSDDAHQTGNQQITVAECWICHPELNKASADYVQRAGTSRAGMRMTVPVRASGLDKAAAVVAKLPEGYVHSVTKPSKRNGGITTLKAAKGVGDGIILKWDAAGRFIYGPSTANGKRVRNVSGAFRAIGF